MKIGDKVKALTKDGSYITGKIKVVEPSKGYKGYKYNRVLLELEDGTKREVRCHDIIEDKGKEKD